MLAHKYKAQAQWLLLTVRTIIVQIPLNVLNVHQDLYSIVSLIHVSLAAKLLVTVVRVIKLETTCVILAQQDILHRTTCVYLVLQLKSLFQTVKHTAPLMPHYVVSAMQTIF